jgi:hypothetical protein
MSAGRGTIPHCKYKLQISNPKLQIITNDQISITKQLDAWNLVIGIYLIIGAWSL